MKKIQDILPDRKEICLLIKNAFSDDFCDEIILGHKNTFKPANLNYPTSYRNNERQVKDDLALSQILFEEIRKYIPRVIEVEGISSIEKGVWNLKCLNDRLRICRYNEGQYFNKHLDGVHFRSRLIQSKLTFMIYLNGGNQEFEGGRTLFFTSKKDDEIIGQYEPSKGDLIIFDHNLWHSGEEVRKGEKYILRSDILYECSAGGIQCNLGQFKEGHLGYIWKIVSDGSNYYTAGRDRLIKIWDKEGKKVDELSGHKNSILDMISVSHNLLVSCSRDKSIKIWKRASNGLLREAYNLVLHESTVIGLLKLNDRKFLSCGADGKLNLIDIEGNLLDSCQAHNEWVWSIDQISTDVVVSAGEDGLLRIWKVHPFESLGEIRMSCPLTALRFDEDEKMLYVGGINGNICGFEVGSDISLKKKFEKNCHHGKIWVIKSDRSYIFSGGEDNKVMIWRKRGMKKVKEYGHKNFVQDLILESDKIISVSYDGEIRELK